MRLASLAANGRMLAAPPVPDYKGNRSQTDIAEEGRVTPMSAQPAGTQRSGEVRPHDKAPRAVRTLGLAAVCLGVVAIAAATFVLSYSGIHALALQARIEPRLARGYPLLIDAMLVVVLAAVLALRGAGLPSRIFAWVTLLVILAAAAGADALHAAGRKLPDHVAAVTAAVVPWVLVFLAFGLLLAMLRHARNRRQAAARGRVAPHGEARAHWQPAAASEAVPAPPTLDLPHRLSAAAIPATAVLASGIPVSGGSATTEAAGPDTAGQPQDVQPEETQPGDAQPGDAQPDDATAAAAEAEPVMSPVVAVPHQPGPDVVADADPGLGAAGQHFVPELAADTDEAADDPSGDEPDSPHGDPGISGAQEPDDPEMPVFHRMWSAPTPPSGM